MKILMPYINVSGESIESDIISGGTELFSKLVYENFDVEVVNISWNTTRDDNKRYVELLHSVAKEKKVDLILSNNIKSVCLRSLKNFGIPIMHITHTNYGNINSNDILNEMTDLGHSLYAVSNSNMEFLNKKSKRLNLPNLNYSGIVSPAYCMYDVSVNKTPQNTVATIGRANSYKMPFYIIPKLKNSKYSPLIITSQGEDDDSIKYYASNKHHPHILNANHNDVIEHLRNSVASVITCPVETFGITALESLSVGTPILIHTNKSGKHASAEIVDNPNYYVCFSGSDTIEDKIDMLSKIDRLEIKQRTQELHSKANWIKTMSNAFDKTIETYNKKHSSDSNLSQFFM